MLPELICTALSVSLGFDRLLGFGVLHDRPVERFAHLTRGQARPVLEQPLTRDRLHSRLPLEHPCGSGVTLTIDVDLGTRPHHTG